MPKLSDTPAPPCKHCGNTNTVNHGKQGDRQRCKCQDCDRTFTVSDGSRPSARKYHSDRASSSKERSKASREKKEEDKNKR